MFRSLFGRAFRDRNGATAIEYALIAALISLALIGGFAAVGKSVGDLLGVVEDSFPEQS